jgi:hypothetical protein
MSGRGILIRIKHWFLKWRKERLPESERGYVTHPQITERTDGRMATRLQYDPKIDNLVFGVFVRCEVPTPDKSGDFCVEFLPPNEVCKNHWCLRSDFSRIYRYRWIAW